MSKNWRNELLKKKADKCKFLSALILCNEAEGARTLNLRIDSPMQQIHKPQGGKDLELHNSCAYKPAYKENLETDENLPADLEEIVAVWPELPEYIKAAIQALVQTKITER